MSADDTTSIASCRFCQKGGLPILPLRYAVARTDNDIPFPRAPVVGGVFGEGVTDVATLPDGQDYTLRLMRAGFLYVYNEIRGSWAGYVVTEKGYLYPYVTEILHQTLVNMNPSKSEGKIDDLIQPPTMCLEFSCKKDANHQYPGRFISIPDADKADNIYLAFSDTAWTKRVWHEHAANTKVGSSNIRRRDQMRKISLAEWRNGEVKHAAAINTFPQYVAEAHIDNTFDLDLNEGLSLDSNGLDSSIYPINGLAGDVDGLISWANEQANSYENMPALMVGITDPIGISSDLNEIIKKRIVIWAEEPVRSQKHKTALMIASLQRAVENGIEDEVSEGRKKISAFFGLLFPAHAGIMSGDGSVNIESYNASVNNAGLISEEELEGLHKEAWNKYLDMYDEKARSKYLEEEYPNQLMKFEDSIISPLDVAYISWLKSSSLSTSFLCNYDDDDLESGSCYTAALYSLICGAVGRKDICDFILECFHKDPEEHTEVFVRGLMLNQQTLIESWVEIAGQGHTPYGGWDAFVNQFYSTFKDKLIAYAADSISSGMRVLQHYSMEVAGVVTRSLKKVFNVSTGSLTATKVEYQSILALGLIAKNESKNLRFIEVRTEPTKLQTFKILQNSLSSLSEGSKFIYKGPGSVESLFDPTTYKRYPYHGLMLIQLDDVSRISTAATITPEDFDLQLQSNLKAQARLASGGFFVSALLTLHVVGSAWEQMKTSPSLKSYTSFGSGLASLAGVTMEGVGALLRSSSIGAMRLSLSLSNTIISINVRTSFLGYAGKIIGAAGAVVTGLIAIWDGVDDLGVKPYYGYSLIGLGVGIIIAGVAVFFASAVIATVAFIISIMISVVMFVVGYMKPDDLEKWLDKTMFFGNDGAGERFTDIEQQQIALENLGSN
ncbi:T6SS effector BTH_I2691 family protein [Cobetia marina]|uniref:T6SS effector BTH_I2691 family protein n=2 Tax=Cobetia TaxID=204286 RepID=UPI002548253D|nr:T6SS effector BTH_I2691 family protein [Cobetia pacifica]MDI6005267.1 T6SS effector BTH_I2691 family protein [Cobetia pacifica]